MKFTTRSLLALALATTPLTPGVSAASVAQKPSPESKVLTLDQALSLARTEQPAIAAFEQDAQASEAAAVAARSLPDPQVTVGIQNFPVTGDDAFSPIDDFMTMYTIGVMREQVRGSRRDAEAARLLADAAVSRFEGTAQQRRIQREVMKAWTDAVEARAKQRLLARVIDDLRTGQKVMQAGVSTGASSAALTLEAQAEVSLAGAQLLQAKGAEARARGELRRWIGMAADAPLPDELPKIELPAEVASPSFEVHPEVLVANAQEQSARRQVDVAQSERRPNISWSVMLGIRPKYGQMVGASVSIPLQINRRNLQDRKISEAQSRSEAARLRAMDTRRELDAEYQQAFADYRSADAQAAQIRDHAIPSLEASFQAAEARYAGGQGTLELPLNIVRRYVEANIQLVEQQGAKARAAADLIYLVGEPRR
jgi:outer membrane protein TolC